MTRSTESEPVDPSCNGWSFALPACATTRLGISLSGGGIRSATFSLGVYQRLAEAGIFQRTRFLSGVSGGGYLASALAISHARGPHDDTDHASPWMRGSVEESHLRQNLSYLAPDGGGRLWLGANLLYGLVLNLTPLVLAAYVSGHLVGRLLSRVHPGIGTDEADFSALQWVATAAVAAVAASIAVVGWRRFRDRVRHSRRGHSSVVAYQLASHLLLTAGVLVVVLGMLPIAVHLMAGWDVLSMRPDDPVEWRLKRFGVGVAAVIAALGLGVVAIWLHQRRRLRAVRGLLAAIAGGAVLVVPFTLAAQRGAVTPWALDRDGLALGIAVAVIVTFGFAVHNRRYSMHLFYRERLQEAFALRRRDDAGKLRVEPIPYEERIRLSQVADANAERTLAGDPFPELVVCAAVAARGSEVPTKARAASFTFEGRQSGNPDLDLEAETAALEDGAGLTLPSMMAISGAALSPMMGRFTLPAFRFLMAVMNVRLGVWLRNPRLAPKRQSRLMRGWWEPGGWYVLKEGLGLAGAGGRFVYVSDGGHWENLGLTELLRRRCTHIVAVDASGSASLADIARAIAVARAELGVEFRFDPRVTVPDEHGIAATPVAVGTFEYPTGERGDIVFARCVLWKDAPADLQMFAKENKLFPNHPTANQFLSGEVFDAYRALGFAVGGVLAETLTLPPEHFDEPRGPLTARPVGTPA